MPTQDQNQLQNVQNSFNGAVGPQSIVDRMGLTPMVQAIKNRRDKILNGESDPQEEVSAE